MSQSKKALITGITGQDGSYLAELLLSKGYEVHGVRRRVSVFNTARIDHIFSDPHQQATKLYMHYGDLSDPSIIYKLVNELQPEEIYNLAAQSHVGVSFNTPEQTADIGGMGVLRILEAVRSCCPGAKIYQASSSEMYGNSKERPQGEDTPFNPQSPYACAKVFAHMLAKNYRQSYNIFVCNGILFNHESPRRGRNFVTRKVTRAAARIKLGLQDVLYLGNLDSKRDWGFAGDYVEAMWLMLQKDHPDDYVVASGQNHSVRELTEIAFSFCGMPIQWRGEGLDEVGVSISDGRVLVRVDPLYFRPSEVSELLGDSQKARRELSWQPKVEFHDLITMMLEHDLENEAKENGWKAY